MAVGSGLPCFVQSLLCNHIRGHHATTIQGSELLTPGSLTRARASSRRLTIKLPSPENCPGPCPTITSCVPPDPSEPGDSPVDGQRLASHEASSVGGKE